MLNRVVSPPATRLPAGSRRYQGMRWIRPTRIRTAAARAIRTAQASRENFGAALDCEVLLIFSSSNFLKFCLGGKVWESLRPEGLSYRALVDDWYIDQEKRAWGPPGMALLRKSMARRASIADSELWSAAEAATRPTRSSAGAGSGDWCARPATVVACWD